MLKQIVFIITFLFLFVVACTFNLSGVEVREVWPSLGSEGDPADSVWLYIDLDEEKYDDNVPLYEISTTEEFGSSRSRPGSVSNCEIEHISSVDRNAGEREKKMEQKTSSPTMLCILDLPEFEFVVKDLHLVYNFPENMCANATIGFPWHFNYNIAPGPIVRECQRNTGRTNDDGEAVTEPGFCDNNSGCNNCVKEENDLCGSRTSRNQPCCYGGSRIEEEGKSGDPWQPDVNCFGGPARVATVSGASAETSQGSAFQTVTTRWVRPLTKNGSKGYITLKNRLSFNRTQNTTAPYANYLRILDRSLNKLPEDRRDFPVFLREDPDFPKRLPRLFFEFACRDAHDDVVHEIRLLIREWDVAEQFNAFVESGGEIVKEPNVTGLEGRQCQYEDRWNDAAGLVEVGEQCNDQRDLEDYQTYPAIDYGSRGGAGSG